MGSNRKEEKRREIMTEQVRKDFENLNENQRLCVIASLLHAYDTSWQVEAYPSLIGFTNHFSNIKDSDLNTPAINPSKKDLVALRKWMIVMGAGHLIPSGA